MSGNVKRPPPGKRSPPAKATSPARKPSPPGPRRPAAKVSPSLPKAEMHPRNRHRQGYDFAALCAVAPALARHLVTTPAGMPSIDFGDPAAVKVFNRALLAADYSIRDWDIPAGYLCPPIPGRVDYLHHLADLLAEGNGGAIPRGERLWVLDVGCGANCIYPLLGHAEYGWRFLGVDIDEAALTNARRILDANQLADAIRLRHQPVADNIFVGLLRSGERFDLTLCNPPFHDSPGSAQAGSQRKWNQLGKPQAARGDGGPRLNFGGQGNELWCPGGERGFLETMIEQSAGIPKRCLWFTSLVSKAENLPHVETALARVHATNVRIVPMAQGQKQSRLVAWTFTNKAERERWRRERWPSAEGGALRPPAATR